MKKLLFALAIVFGTTAFSQNLGDVINDPRGTATDTSQRLTEEGGSKLLRALGDARFGLRAFGMINSSSLGNFKDVKDLSGSGFSVGIAGIVNITDNFFVTPELHYSHAGVSELDLPILFGYSIFENFDIIAGPSLMYSFSKESKKHLEDAAVGAATGGLDYKGLLSSFQVGYVAGLQYHIGKFMISARYQGTFSGKIAEYVKEGTGVDFKDSTQERVKTSYVSLGIGFNFGEKRR